MANSINSFQILFQDEYLAIIFKPAGLLSVPYPGGHGKTAQDTLENAMRKQGTWNKNHKPFAVHRLDRDTSGILMFALNYQAQQKIMNTWHQMVTERLYRAVGENPQNAKIPDSGLINAPLAQNSYHQSYVPANIPNNEKNQNLSQSSNTTNTRQRSDTHHHRRKSGVNSFNTQKGNTRQSSKMQLSPARTNYRIITRGSVYTLFELSLDTGKKNQIRAHLAYLGYPLAGDSNYRAKTDPFHRLALHARTLDFTHPYTGKKLHFEAPEPANWAKTVARAH